MKKDEIIATIKALACSQGFYGRILEQIECSPNKEQILEELEKQNFKDAIDLVMFFEC